MPTRVPALLLAALLAGACGPATDVATAASVEGARADGFPLPQVELVSLSGDTVWHTSSVLGTPTVINFWATWCAPCVEEMPAIEAVHQAMGGAVAFVGVDRADTPAMARELAARTGVTYTLVADPDSALFAAVGARAMPTTLFVDADGNVVHRHAGPLDEQQLTRLVDDHLR